MSEGDVKARNPALAGFLSFLVPGLGQLYNGQEQLAVLFFLGVNGGVVMSMIRFIGAIGAADARAALGTTLIWGGLATLLWLGGIVQAVFAALDRPEYFLRKFNLPAVYAGVIALYWVGVPVLFSKPLFRWMLARNGVETEEQVTAWMMKMGAFRAGTPAPTPAPPEPDSMPAVPVVTEVEPGKQPDPEVAARGAATAIHQVLVGGRDGGIYDMHTAVPICTFRRGPQPSWTSLYANPGDTLGVTAFQFRIPVDTGETDRFQVSVNIGNLPRGRSYTVDSRSGAPPPGDVLPRASVVRREGGAVIRIVGESPERVRFEATVRCRRVTGD
jgi:TM2 domain-containing membrane protein YozV